MTSEIEPTSTRRDEAPRPKKKRLDPLLVGNVGLYYCCYHLSLLGWNVMPTARNARGVDIIAYNHDASHFVGVQVKALSQRAAVPLGTSLDNIMGDFWVVVNRVTSNTPAAFVMLPCEVRKRATMSGRDGRASYWLEPRDYEEEPFRDAWEAIGNPLIEG
ncbi:hypothetical protein H0I76_18600 [Limibaculum sp. M0105]|uniref:PD(D/E)XK endonuclease domain-containing protein n=1 Tax=Thermohalobaculum xanthum TaxID=2753746 RepID=A0A8J7MBN1_9RHOB|nr:hypothetical protein [Thermohalobaculum xanthum]MBK0401214.1 hypothetical protein [Thermohalobaculum xanthum]